MRRLALTTLGAVLAFALLAGTAGARTGLSFNPESLTIFIHSIEGSGGFGTVRCDMTMSIAATTTVAKRVGAVLTHTTVATSTSVCQAGDIGIIERNGVRVTGLQGPYELQYESFEGELPNITAVTLKLVGVHLWIREPTFGTICETTEPISMTTTGGNPATGVSINRSGIALGGSGCSFTSMTLRGAGSIYRELAHGTRESVTITLV